MKKILFVLGAVLLSLFGSASMGHAEVEWAQIKKLNLQAQPLAIASSADGQWIYILTPGEVLVYNVAQDNVTDRIPVEKAMDSLVYSASNNSLVLSSTADKTLSILQLEFIHKFSIDGLPVRGPQNARVLIAVFSDYQ